MSATEQRTLCYGTIPVAYTLTYESRRTLAVHVRPDLCVSVVAPEGTTLEEIEARLRKRARWILKRQRQYETYLPHLPPRQYVSGETHRYLGRQYRLKVEGGAAEGVTLGRSYLTIGVHDNSDTDRVRELLHAWYRERAEEVFAQRLEACHPKVAHLSIPFPRLTVRVMRTRWGSASPQGRVTLNVKLIQVPVAYIDYVIYHELCHLREPHHGPAYYRLLDRIQPDWRERREGLNGYQFG